MQQPASIEARRPGVRESGRPLRRPDTAQLVLVGLLLAGLVLRIALYRTTWHQPDADEATGLVMALQASKGHLSLLFWGGNYGGALITWIEAPLLALFGFHFLTFWVVDTLVALAGVVLLHRIALRLLPPVAAAVAGGLFFCFPAEWVFWSMREFVFWLPAVVLALATCLLVMRWFETRATALVVGIGLTAGLAIWSYPLVAPLLLPALAVFVYDVRRRPRLVAGFAVTGLVGVVPWLAYFAVHGRHALQVQQTREGRATALAHSITQVIPTVLDGGQKRFDLIWMIPGPVGAFAAVIGIVVLLGVCGLTAYFAVRRQVGLLCCCASVLLWPLVLVAGHVPVSTASFRYGLIVVAPLLVLGAWVFARLRLSLLLAVLAVASTVRIAWIDTSAFAAVPACSPGVSAVDSWLEQHGRDHVWASYWLASTLEVCAPTRVTAAAVAPQRDHRAVVAAEQAPASTYVVFAGNQLDMQLTRLAAHGGALHKTVVGGYAVWTFDQPAGPGDLQLQGGAF